MIQPLLDPGFEPAVHWVRRYREACEAEPASRDVVIALERPDGTVYTVPLRLLPASDAHAARTHRYVERMVKFLLWQKGGSTIAVCGAPDVAAHLGGIYCADGERAFDADLMGTRVFLAGVRVVSRDLEEAPARHEPKVSVGGSTEGCRIGFDLGGSDRKCAAVIDGKVVFSEEVEWDPYFQSDPEYHTSGIRHSLEQAAAHLPRVDAIGGSAAGIYIESEPRVASLFRGVSDADFAARVRPLFRTLRAEWDDVPFVVANDGDVTALAGARSLGDCPVLGIAMGTSMAAGYCDANGHITSWLNELAFVPVDFREDAPADEWSGDLGCGVQYFSQQAVARLMPAAGIVVDDPALSLPDRLKQVQSLMDGGDERARKIYQTLGAYLGYGLAWFAEFYELKHVLLMGRVTSGPGGAIIIAEAEDILRAEFTAVAGAVSISAPDETMKRHGQAIAAASLPSLAG
jgi:predicted NBD/HSP70 family sugar kinase